MNQHRIVRGVASATLLFCMVACGGGGAEPAKPSGSGEASVRVSKADKVQAEKLFTSLCVTCHGTTGLGDGPGAAAMDPKPRSFADPAWQDSVDDEAIRKAIVLGGAAVGKSPMMPAQPQLKSKKGVLQAIVDKIRGFRGK